MDSLQQACALAVSTQNGDALVAICSMNQLWTLGNIAGSHYNIVADVAKDAYSLCAFHCENYKKAIQLIDEVLDKTLDSKERERLFRNRAYAVDKALALYETTPSILPKFESKRNNVILTMTTCKRFDHFVKTVNSFINCCTDLALVDKWLVVDDNSSEEDRIQMKTKYPFIEFIFKDASNKGHPKSMNILRKRCMEYTYQFHLEDDWTFFSQRPYISNCLEILDENANYGQALINPEYAERVWDFEHTGVREQITSSGKIYYTHDHCSQEQAFQRYGPTKNSCYWPHYSLRPGVTRVRVLRKIGEYDESAAHFEREYANRYEKLSFVTAFLDRISCSHTGRLTSEIGTDVKNAYDLNNESQFVAKKDVTVDNFYEISDSASEFTPNEINHADRLQTIHEELDDEFKFPQIFCINLDRRPDRYENFQKLEISAERFSAIDGEKVVPSAELTQLFEYNDFNMRRGMVGCALSHMKLWCDQIRDNLETIVVLEDDITVTPNFMRKLKNVIKTLPGELTYLGYFPWIETPEMRKETENHNFVKVASNETFTLSKGGTIGYILKLSAAKKLMNFIARNTVTNGIDWVMMHAASDVDTYYPVEHLVFSECLTPSNASIVDTDIQKDYSSLNCLPKNYDYLVACFSDKQILEVTEEALLQENRLYKNSLLVVRDRKFLKYCLREYSETHSIISTIPVRSMNFDTYSYVEYEDCTLFGVKPLALRTLNNIDFCLRTN